MTATTTTHIPSKKPLLLVDGSSYLFRAYYALPPLTTSQGQATGAIYGVINMLRKLLDDYQPDYIAVVFDSKSKNFRHDLLPSYKANRAAMPDDLQQQIAPLHQCIKAMGLPLIVKDGVEADDVIGTLATQAAQQGFDVLISTIDKDMAQLVNKHITLIDTMKNKHYDRDAVIKKFGVPPEKIIDYLALAGDSSDNITGIPKVGPKTAILWLNKYGSIQNIIQSADQFTGVLGNNLRAHLEDLATFQQLVTIRCQETLAVSVDQLEKSNPDIDQLIQLYTQLEFGQWLKKLKHGAHAHSDGSNAMVSANLASDYQTILDKKSFMDLLQRLQNAELIAIDTETDNQNPMHANLVGLSFSTEAHKAVYIPLAHDYSDAPKQLEKTWVLSQLQKIAQDPKKCFVGHNIKYDLLVLAKDKLTLAGSLYDTLLASHVLNSTASRLNLDALAEKYLQKTTITFAQVAGTGKKQLTFNQVDLAKATPYAAEDADVTLQLHHLLMPQLAQLPQVLSVFTEIELPLIRVLTRMQQQGVLVDPTMLSQHSQALDKKLKTLAEQAYQLAGEVFNINSTQQLQTILFEKLKLPTLRKTATGQFSTGESVLQELALDYPLPKIILQYRHLAKLKSTYTDSLPADIHPQTGRVHTSYHQAGTATGRLSSSQPNLQNIPIRTAEGRKIRCAFIAPKNYLLLSADYSQVELRIIAHLSEDPALLNAFHNNLDIHQATASEIFATAVDQVSTEQRRRAKAINFGLLYGMSAFGLAKQLGISHQEAHQYMTTYFERYPKVRDYIEHTRQHAKQHGYVETIYGRRLYTPDINAKLNPRRQAAERAAINAPMQGSAADIIKRAMIAVDHWLIHDKVDAHMVMQVHDELVLEVHQDLIESVRSTVCALMQSAANLKVPLLVDTGIGHNWDEAH